MRTLLAAIVILTSLAPIHARSDDEGELKELHAVRNKVLKETAASKLTLSKEEAAREIERVQRMMDAHNELMRRAKEAAELNSDLPRAETGQAVAVKKIAVFAVTEERAEVIGKIIRLKYCRESACDIVIEKAMGWHPSDRDLFDQLVRAHRGKFAYVGLDHGMWVGGGAGVKLQQIKEQGGVISSYGFSGENGNGFYEVCDADLGGPGCGGD